MSDDQEELYQEQHGDHIGQCGDLLGLAGEDLDDGVGDEADADGMADGAGDGHGDEHQRDGHHLVQIVEVHILQTHDHQHAHIDEGGGGGRRGNDGGDGGNEDAGQEENAGGEGGQACAAAGLHAGGGLHEGGDGGGTGAGAGHGADGVGQEGFLHVGHVAVLIHHAGTGGGAHQGADGIEHVDHAEGDHQGDGGEPADLQKAVEVKLEEGRLHHVGEGRHKGSSGEGREGIHAQHREVADPVDDGRHQHAQQHRGLDAFLGQDHGDEEAHEHGHHSEDHGGVAAAHSGLGHAGGQRAEEVPHHVEGAAIFRVHAHVGTQADVHQHEADGGGDAKAHTQRDGVDDLLPDVENGEDQKDDALQQNDDQGGLEGLDIAHAGEGHDVGNHHGKEAVEAHAGGQCEGLVGQKRHAEHGQCGGDAGGQEHTVPKGRTRIKVGEQVGVQGDDVGHGHEGGKTGQDLRADSGAVFL